MAPSTALNSTERFSSRVDNYVKYRPSYPAQVLDLLRVRCGLGSSTAVADLGSGTGILTRLLLATGATVYAVEPNREMRTAAESALSGASRFHSVDATAESTGLAGSSIALVTASQAFHWFDVTRARRESQRILQPRGWVALIWNERPLEPIPFMDEYDALLRRHADEYDRVTRSRVEESRIREFFAGRYELTTFGYAQQFDFAGLEGRLMSSSYAPEPGHAQYEPMMQGLRELFERHQRGGTVDFPYRTLVYLGRLD